MNSFDDYQIEDLSGFDFAEASYDGFFEEEENDEKTFQAFLNSNWDF